MNTKNMHLIIKSISATSNDCYRAVFDANTGQQVEVLFTFRTVKGISVIDCEPDIFMKGHVYAKDIIAIVTTFRAARMRNQED